MKIGIKLNLQTFRTATLTEDFSINFTDISNLQDWDDSITVSADVVNELEMYYHDGEKYLGVDTTNPVQQPEDEFYDDDVNRPSLEGYIKFNCIVSDSDLSTLIKLINLNIVELDQFGKTNIIAYRLNDERDNLSKNLIPVTILEGSFKAPLGIKSLELDVVNYDINNSYNYVYIPRLKRYYYVSNIQLTTKDYTKLLLQEDVLMSWATLIKSQKALISRSQYNYNINLVDQRRPLKDIPTVQYITPTRISGPDLFEIDLSRDLTINKIMVTVLNDTPTYHGGGLFPPYIDGLPDVRVTRNCQEHVYFLNEIDFYKLCEAMYQDDTIASFVVSIIWLPFDPYGVMIPLGTEKTNLQVKNKVVSANGRFIEPSSSEAKLEVYETNITCSPYLMLERFNEQMNDEIFFNREPYASYELYIPFVSWIKISSKQLFDNNIYVYYSIEFNSGMATAYVYDKTHEKIIFSSTCQLGVKLDVSTTNLYENIKQKQSNDLNMIMGGLSSLVSIGIGVATENPLAVVGGVLSGGKAVANYVNSNRTIFDRASVQFGSGTGALYTEQKVMIRKTYNEPINIDLPTYRHMEGCPRNEYVESLSNITGYVEIGDIHFNANGNNIYQTEIDEIVALLKNGVIL